MIDFTKLRSLLEQNKSFLLTTHVNPDADALGSALALYFVLRKLNKDVRIVNHSETPYNLHFLDPNNVIEKYEPSEHDKYFDEVDAIVVLDLNQANRIVSMEKKFTESDAMKICIDHHKDATEFVDYLFIDDNYAATAEIIFDLIEQTNIVELDKDIAVQIYAGIITDTGSFRYERTTARTHRIVSHLIEAGVNPETISDEIYYKNDFSKFKLLAQSLSTLSLYGEGKIAYMLVTQKAIEDTGAIEADVDGFVSYCMSVKDVKIGLLFYELKDGFKISFRSKGDIPINKLAGEFGGGGHFHAGGTRLYNESLDEYIPKVLTTAEHYIKISETKK